MYVDETYVHISIINKLNLRGTEGVKFITKIKLDKR